VSCVSQCRGYVACVFKCRGYVACVLECRGYVACVLECRGYVACVLECSGYVACVLECRGYVACVFECSGYVWCLAHLGRTNNGLIASDNVTQLLSNFAVQLAISEVQVNRYGLKVNGTSGCGLWWWCYIYVI
jgi:hypothetical protein